MDFDFTEDQESLRDAVRRWVDKGYDFERRRGIVRAGGFDRSVYAELANLGLTGLYVPDAHGGNMDTPEMRAGTTCYLGVNVDGALFSLGDTHAAQGDGEVCGTAVETAMDVVLRISVRRDFTVDAPQYRLPPGLVAEPERTAYHVCTGVGPDLIEAARDAVRATISHLGERRGLDRSEAYALVSVACDLRIHEVVDAPNWVVGCFVPESIFEGGTDGD